MKQLFIFASFVLLTIGSFANSGFQFLSPMPGSTMINPEHNIVIREGSKLDPSLVLSAIFSIRGTMSGKHEFNLVLARDGKTIILTPLTVFGFNEEVSVSISNGLKAADGRSIDPYTFSFTTHREFTVAEKEAFKTLRRVLLNEEIKQWVEPEEPTAEIRDFEDMFDITVNTNPSPGHVFYDVFSGFFFPNEFSGYHVITVNGDSVYSKGDFDGNDFNQQSNGNFAVRNNDEGRWDELDSNFSVIDKYYPYNGYTPDYHDIQILANGNAIYIAAEYQIVDMTVYDPQYSENANVLGTVIQEVDADHNLIFEWRSFDHVGILEGQHISFAFSFIDYIHTNSVEEDDDGHIIASHRHLDQVTKIDRNSGEFIWRMGGLNNEFTFINEPEPIPFTYQHDARRIENGNLTLYDNGNYHIPARSYAKEYQLDEVNKTATLVWSYSHPNSNNTGYLYYFAMGNVQRLPSGNTFINWGWRSSTTNPSMTEVNPDGEIVWELKLAGGFSALIAYRSHKHEWDPCARPTFKKMKTHTITDHSAKLKWADVANNVEYHVQYKKHDESIWKEKIVSGQHYYHAYGLAPETKYDWKIETWCTADGSKTSGYTDIKKFTTLAQRGIVLNENPEIGILMYPNPAQQWLTVELISSSVDQLRILNVLGMEMMKLSFQSEGNSSIQIPLQNLLSGNYLVEFSGPVSRITEKFVVE